MKRNVSILLTLILIILTLTSCGNINKAEESPPEMTVIEFTKKMYNVEDYKKIDVKNLNIQYPKDKYTNELREIATEKALEPFITNRLQLEYITYCYELHVNSVLISSSVGKHTNEDDGSIVYNLDGKVKLTFTDENLQKEEDIRGQVTVNKIDNKWTITKINDVSIEGIAKYYKNSKQ